jgi:hypothetical protein
MAAELLILSFNDWLDKVYPDLETCEFCNGADWIPCDSCNGEGCNECFQAGGWECTEGHHELSEAHMEYAAQVAEDKRHWAEYQSRMQKEKFLQETK